MGTEPTENVSNAVPERQIVGEKCRRRRGEWTFGKEKNGFLRVDAAREHRGEGPRPFARHTSHAEDRKRSRRRFSKIVVAIGVRWSRSTRKEFYFIQRKPLAQNTSKVPSRKGPLQHLFPDSVLHPHQQHPRD